MCWSNIQKWLHNIGRQNWVELCSNITPKGKNSFCVPRCLTTQVSTFFFAQNTKMIAIKSWKNYLQILQNPIAVHWYQFPWRSRMFRVSFTQWWVSLLQKAAEFFDASGVICSHVWATTPATWRTTREQDQQIPLCHHIVVMDHKPGSLVVHEPMRRLRIGRREYWTAPKTLLTFSTCTSASQLGPV